ncbi:MAG: IS110 family transposase [Anaerolineales bacterium]
MQRYLGLDVHSDSCTLSVLSEAGKEVRREVVETNGRALVGLLKQIPGALHLCVEESEWSQWLYEILSPHVAEMVVVWAEGKRGAKSDAIDARGLAERLRTGRLGRVVYKAARQYGRLRELARVYGLLTRDVARTKNRIKSLFRRRGVPCPGEAIYHAEVREKRLAVLPPAMRRAVELLGFELECLEELKAEAEEAMLEEAGRYRISRILDTAPGMGPIRVAQLLPIVITPHRFRTKRQFWAYCGFGVVTRSSADWVRQDSRWVKMQVPQTRGLNRNYNRTLKLIFKGAATTVIAHARPSPLREAYERLCAEGTKPNLAKLTVARKIAAAVLAMWKSEEVYDRTRA